MIVFSEASSQLTPSASAQSLNAVTEAAKIVGCRVMYIPQQERCPSASDALAYMPAQDRETVGVWIGYIPSPEWYASIYNEALHKRIRLLNTPEEYQNAQEFDRAYANLQELTPTSIIIADIAECAEAVRQLGLPVFVKGAIQSRKASGWKACVAETSEELVRLCVPLFASDTRSRGRVVVRKLVRLRHHRISGEGFPFGREYRVFLHRQQVLGFGYYWEGDDPLKPLQPAEQTAVLTLALEAARRVGTPFVTVDIGQTEEGHWIVIETGDAQFSGTCQIPLLSLWHAIRNINP